MSVAICRDDLWLGVKSQSNPEIAGSLRNPFRWSVTKSFLEYCKQLPISSHIACNVVTNLITSSPISSFCLQNDEIGEDVIK
jgi:hypothetical protein